MKAGKKRQNKNTHNQGYTNTIYNVEDLPVYIHAGYNYTYEPI